jgi:hypothetical protein
MTTYTPGPYTVRPSQFDNELLILADETCIAAVPLWENDGEEDTLAEQSRANAALLAAAPELFIAVQCLIAQIDSLHGQSSCIDEDLEQGKPYQMAQAAIAKVRPA